MKDNHAVLRLEAGSTCSEVFIADLLERQGVKVNIIRDEHYNAKMELTWDHADIYEKRSRKAGRKRAIAYMPLNVLRERLKTESAEELAKYLGVSRATLFRRIKEAEDHGRDYII